MAQESDAQQQLDSAVAEGGAYEVIKKRLIEQGQQLESQTQALNQQRLDEFGSSDMQVLARTRVRTENNCIARDLVQVGKHLLFAYNVYIGLKKETKVEDVFALFELEQNGSDYELKPVDSSQSFLAQPSFVSDFEELYRYYKHTKLVELTVKDGKLLAGFQIGERLEDLRVFRWSISADGSEINYLDNRGERDIQLPPAYDFEWRQTSREDAVHGRHPHINILDKVFVETVGGDLTIKVENNTEDGLGIYREAVEDKTQSLDDGQIEYAEIGALILLKVRPYREEQWRYLVFNSLTEEVRRIDAIGQSCVQLPEDHGIIFPGGYYLQGGEEKHFAEEVSGLQYKRKIASPNGEDILYVFYQPENGDVALLAYNMIDKGLQNPVYCHGYALAQDGQLVIFSAESEPTRVHPMQVWQTPYCSREFASQQEASQSYLGKIGNAELVRGISDLYSISRAIAKQQVSQRLYGELATAAKKVFDDHYWLADEANVALAELLKQVSDTAELVIDEFEKVASIRQQSSLAMQEAEQEQKNLLSQMQPDNWQLAQEYVEALGRLRQQRGHLISIKELRYIDLNRIEQLGQELEKLEDEIANKTVEFLAQPKALEPYHEQIADYQTELEKVSTVAELHPLLEKVEASADGLDLLSQLMGGLSIADATVRTAIIDEISNVYAKLNQTKAQANNKRKNMGSAEAVAQFSAQFKLFGQSITNALDVADTPQACDEQLARLLVQLEELESQFSEHEGFLADIMDKREQIYESFESHKQQLLDQRQRRAQGVIDAANRMLSSIEKRSLKFTEPDQLNTYFASDTLVLKVLEQVELLRELDNSVQADDIDARFKALKEQALRALRDKTDIYEEGGNVIKLGPKHKFSVNTQELDLTLIARETGLSLHLTGTDFYQAVEVPELMALKDYWLMDLVSETKAVYRGEYLAYQIYQAAQLQQQGLNTSELALTLKDDEKADKLVRDFAAPLYKEAYQKGVHDVDARRILQALIPVVEQADLLSFNACARALAQLFWLAFDKRAAGDKSLKARLESWRLNAISAAQLLNQFGRIDAQELLAQELSLELQAFCQLQGFDFTAGQIASAGRYLSAELGRQDLAFITAQYAEDLLLGFKQQLSQQALLELEQALEQALQLECDNNYANAWHLARVWLATYLDQQGEASAKLAAFVPEAIALLIAPNLSRRSSSVQTQVVVEDLLGDHVRIADSSLSFALDEFLSRLALHQQQVVPGYLSYLEQRQEYIQAQKQALRLHEFKARPLSSFVRNRLINESYLPLIGANLAKQMGTVGEDKRTDLMGLLMMISPPGYGKTTLMEYVANRLGLIFMKINCPSLGHEVVSLDPAQAPNATAGQELEKLNLALEMGNNVMLYLDDIQHTDPEFLQKFISLCDGTRRIEGVWQGQTKTYDMRGRKFCVVMAGNPYTESGEAFKIPDMLANRADIYNLGDILGGMDEQFALSYIENSLTSNSVLAPLALRDMQDVYKLVDLAKGKEVATTDLSFAYSGAEINEICDILRKMLQVQEVVLKINQQYIISAAQNDDYREEPAFKLQGSYRNMNKMTEKISAVMNEQELLQMIEDHYLGEAQLLTSGAEDNLLKLAELRGNMTAEQSERWAKIKADFLRNKAMGGADADVGSKVVGQLVDMASALNAVQKNIKAATSVVAAADTQASNDIAEPQLPSLSAEQLALEQQQLVNQEALQALLSGLGELIGKLTQPALPSPQVEVINQPVPGMDKILATLAQTIEHSLLPLVRNMDKKLDIDLRTHDNMQDIIDQLRSLELQVKEKK